MLVVISLLVPESSFLVCEMSKTDVLSGSVSSHFMLPNDLLSNVLVLRRLRPGAGVWCACPLAYIVPLIP